MTEGQPERPVRAEDLPPMHEGSLDHDGLAALQRDLEQCAQVIGVRVKGAGQAIASDARPGLDEAFEAIRNGGAVGVQIRYRYQGEAWCDTLMRGKDGVRLVRVRAFDGEEQ